MALQTPATTVLFRRDTEENWQSVNPVLMIGEIGIVYGAISTDGTSGDLLVTEDGNTQLYFKLGDGKSRWNDLPVASGKQGEKGDSATIIEGVTNEEVKNAANSIKYTQIDSYNSLLEIVADSGICIGQYCITEHVKGLPLLNAAGINEDLQPQDVPSNTKWGLTTKLKSTDAQEMALEVFSYEYKRSFSIMRVNGVWGSHWSELNAQPKQDWVLARFAIPFSVGIGVTKEFATENATGQSSWITLKNSQITIPENGMYKIVIHLALHASNSAGSASLRVENINTGVFYTYAISHTAGQAAWASINETVFFPANTGDIIKTTIVPTGSPYTLATSSFNGIMCRKIGEL